jgi:hypothetical protein
MVRIEEVGNLVVVLVGDRAILAFGPGWKIPVAGWALLAAQILMLNYGLLYLQPIECHIIGWVLSGIILTSAAVLVTVSPGLQIQPEACAQIHKQRGRYCVVCNINKLDLTKHCPTCDVCILSRRFHSFFLDKCIGLYSFLPYYLTILFISLYLALLFFAFLYTLCLTS